MTATARAERLMLLTEQLADLIRREITILEQRRPAELSALAEDRNRLALLYGREIKAVRADPALLQGAPKALTAALAKATRALDQLIEAHQEKVLAMRSVTEGLVQAIAAEVARKRTPQTTYGKPVAPQGPRPPSVVFNQAI